MNDYVKAPEWSLEETFLRLCFYTTPHGTESWCWSMIPGHQYLDEHGNVSVIVKNPNGSYPSTMFTSHTDTACYKQERVRFKIQYDAETGDKYIKTDGNTILGADCKIGVALMIKMIHAGVPGMYVFFAGEERGCIGSKAMAKEWNAEDPKFAAINKCISFDRYGYSDIITHQAWGQCCSEDFANSLCQHLQIQDSEEMKPDDGGIFTDSAEFVDIIAECTNICVGYLNHHTHREQQNITFAEELLVKLIACPWDDLPIVREPGDYGSYSYGSSFGSYGIGLDDYDYDIYPVKLTKHDGTHPLMTDSEYDDWLNEQGLSTPGTDVDSIRWTDNDYDTDNNLVSKSLAGCFACEDCGRINVIDFTDPMYHMDTHYCKCCAPVDVFNELDPNYIDEDEIEPKDIHLFKYIKSTYKENQ